MWPTPIPGTPSSDTELCGGLQCQHSKGKAETVPSGTQMWEHFVNYKAAVWLVVFVGLLFVSLGFVWFYLFVVFIGKGLSKHIPLDFEIIVKLSSHFISHGITFYSNNSNTTSVDLKELYDSSISAGVLFKFFVLFFLNQAS